METAKQFALNDQDTAMIGDFNKAILSNDSVRLCVILFLSY